MAKFEKKKIKHIRKYYLKKIDERAKAKKDGNFDLADKIRNDLFDQGILIEDQKEKTIWKFK